MKNLMKLGCLGLVGLVVLVVIIAVATGGGGEDTTTAGSGSNTSTEPKAAKPKPKKAMKVKAAAMLKEFEGNEAAADAKYSGKTLRVSGIVEKVDTDLLNDEEYIVQLAGGSDFEILTVDCPGQAPAVAAKINKGDKATVVGDFDDGGDLGVTLKNCTVEK